MGNNLISPRNAKVFSYNSPERTKVPSLTPDLTTVKLLIERQDWRGLQQILLDNKEWLLSPTSSGNGCLIAGKHPLHHALCVQAPKFFIETILKIDYSSVDKLSEDQRDEKGFQAIHFAVKFKNSVDVLETIMKYDERAYEKLDHAGRLPLHVALLAGNQMDIIEYLVGLHPLSIKTRTKSGGFPLHLALEGKCIIDVIKFLIARNPDTTRQSYNANLPLHVACASKCTLEVFDLLYSCNENAVHCFGEESKPVLHFAVASKCCIEIIKKLIDLNEEFLLHRDKTARMPIHYAIENRVNDETLMLLIERSPQSLSCRGRGTPGNYPLAMAIEKNISTAIILEMIHIYPAAVKQKTVYGMFPLRSAIREKISGDVLLALLDVYPDAASEVDEHGRVALHYASSRDTPIVLIDALISSYPLGISKADRNNQIPLHLACIRLCSLSLIRLLLDRFRQGARYLDIYQNTPLNYVIENNGGLEYYKTLIDSDKKCMELFPPDSLSKLQGKLPLHQAIEFQREYSVIELLARSYPDGCSIAQVSTGRLALHLAIMRPLSIDSLLVIEETYPAAAQVADNDGLFPVHYAIKMKTDSQLISRLLKNNRKLTRLNHFPLHMKRSQACQEPLHAQPFDDDDRQDCCQGHRLLLHYAIDESTSPENVAEILKYTMPYDCDKGQYFHEHFYTWTHILAHTNDLYWKSIEIVLQPYSSSIISLLSEFLDEHQRKAIDIATPRCHRVILYRLHYYARYELPSTKNIHLTNITMLKRGIDHFQGKKLPVILKFYSCFQSFINELKLRESVALDDRYVVPLIQAHNGDEDYNYREESIQKRFEQYRYLMVVNAGYRSLDDIIRHDFISPTNCSGETITVSETRDMTQGDATAVKNYGRQILAALQHLHDLGVCHGNLHPGHIIDFDGVLKVGDLGFATRVTLAEPIKVSYGRRALAYSAPEIAQIYLDSHQEKNCGMMLASSSMDMWSFGAILFYLCTGEELFLTSFEKNIDRDQLEILAKWPLFAKTKRMKKIKDPVARNLIEQLLNLEVRLRPSARECLKHPFFQQEKFEEQKGNIQVRYLGMQAMFDIYISYRHSPLQRDEFDEDLLTNDRLQQIKKAKGINKHLVDDAIHAHDICQHLRSHINYTVVESSRSISVATNNPHLVISSPHTNNFPESLFAKVPAEETKELAVRKENRLSQSEDAVYDSLFRHVTNSKVYVILLSRFAVNCNELSISALSKTSPCHYFLFELRLAFELVSRGLIEGGIFVVAFGDLLPPTGDDLKGGEQSTLGQDDWRYQPFFQHFQQEITLSSGNAFPNKLPDVVVENLENVVAYFLEHYGFGKLHHPNFSIKEMFRQLLQMPTIHVQGPKQLAMDSALMDLSTVLQQKLNRFGTLQSSNGGGRTFSNILSMTRPQTSAFQRMLDTRIPSPELNQRTPVNWFKDREPLVPQSPLHNYSINDIVSQAQTGDFAFTSGRGGLYSRHGLRSSHGMGATSTPAKSSKVASSMAKEVGEGDYCEQDVKFFDNSASNPEDVYSYTSNLQLHKQNQPQQTIPFFTEIVSMDKATSEEMMLYLVEKMEVRDTQVNNLVLELTLMEERIRLQQLEIHRLRSLVQVTQTLNMDDGRDEES